MSVLNMNVVPQFRAILEKVQTLLVDYYFFLLTNWLEIFDLNECEDYSVKEYCLITEDLCNLEFYNKLVLYL